MLLWSFILFFYLINWSYCLMWNTGVKWIIFSYFLINLKPFIELNKTLLILLLLKINRSNVMNSSTFILSVLFRYFWEYLKWFVVVVKCFFVLRLSFINSSDTVRFSCCLERVLLSYFFYYFKWFIVIFNRIFFPLFINSIKYEFYFAFENSFFNEEDFKTIKLIKINKNWYKKQKATSINTCNSSYSNYPFFR